MVDAGHHKDLLPCSDGSLFFQLPQFLNQAGADVHLLHLIAADCCHHRTGFFALPEPEPLDLEFLAVRGLQCIKNFLSHCANPPVKMRASRLPG